MPAKPRGRPKGSTDKAPRNVGGRPTVLTEKVWKESVKFARRGNYIETIAHLVGVAPSTLKRWVQEGSRDPRCGNARTRLGRFSDEFKCALAESEDEDLGEIKKEKHWTARAWRLERRHPKRWGVKQNNEEVEKQVQQLARTILGGMFALLKKHLPVNHARELVIECGKIADQAYEGMPELQAPANEARELEGDEGGRR